VTCSHTGLSSKQSKNKTDFPKVPKSSKNFQKQSKNKPDFPKVEDTFEQLTHTQNKTILLSVLDHL